MTLRAILPRLVLGLALAGAVIWLALNRDRVDPALIESSIRDLGLWAPLAHVVLFAVATVLFVPGAILGLTGGALFGPLWGTILNLIGATLGATAAFLAARYLAADWVRRKAGGRLERLITEVEGFGRGALIVRETELVCKLEHMSRSRVGVELGRLRQSQAIAFGKVFDVALRQCP